MASAGLTPADLVGGYTILSGEKFGQPEPEERVRGTTVRFTETDVVVSDKDTKETYAATYRLDAGRSPCGITMTATRAPNSGDVAEGLIEKNGDTIRLIYALPGAEKPTGFRTGPKQLLFEMRNLNK
ncbi:MAG: TIGR03067 domain-containing protein [Gemmataceae bacterium]|nr:TIGR03067 domain-containing protein [Gemmataceae bacterium]